MAITYHAGRRVQGLSTEGVSTVTYEDDFSTDKGWTTTDSGRYSYNSGGWIDFDAQSDQSDNRISIDIGTTLSNTAWVMRWKQEVTGFTQGTQAQHLSLDIGISDREVNGATAIGMIKAHHASNNSNNYISVAGHAVTDGTEYDSYGSNYPNNHVSGFTPSAKTNWVELKRTGSTTASLAFYTDDSYSASALDGSVKTITMPSSPTGLRYIMLGSEYANQIAGNARYSGKFSELKIYDGVTSVVTETQRPTNVQVGSRFEETDTRKTYSYADVSTSELKAYYNFDSTSGGLVNQATTGDGLGSSADGTNTSVTLDTTNEKIGTGCYNFDGSDDYVELGSSVSQWNFCHEANHKWSCAFWYKSNNAPSGYEYIIGNTRASSSDVGFVIGVHTSRRMYFAVVGTTKALDDYLTANDIIPDDEWHHYTCTFDATLSSENLKIYRDGSQVDTANYASWTPSGGDAGRALYIGTDKGYSTGYLDGKLDDMGIWNRVLTSNEVSFLYNSGTGATVDNAKGWQEIGT